MKFAFVSFLAATLFASVACAELKTNIEYSKADGQVLRLDANVPDGASAFPVVIAVHGGGWWGGQKRKRRLRAGATGSDYESFHLVFH
jgi:acetyl esterase/lipase